MLNVSREIRTRSHALRARAESLHDRSADVRRRVDAIHERTARLLQLLTLRAEPANADRMLATALVRVRGEFQENPDLQASVEEIARLIDVDSSTVRRCSRRSSEPGFSNARLDQST